MHRESRVERRQGIKIHHAPVSHMMSLDRNNTLCYATELLDNVRALAPTIHSLPLGEAILVFCRHGKHRSAFYVAALLAIATQASLEDVELTMRHNRPLVDLRFAKDTWHCCGFDTLHALKDYLPELAQELGFGHDRLPVVVSATDFLAMLADKRRILMMARTHIDPN